MGSGGYRLACHFTRGVAGFGGDFDGCATEADAARSDCDHHERLWERDDGVQTRGQSQGGADGARANVGEQQ